MQSATYTQRRGQLEVYFDRTAAAAWARLTSDAPVSGIRATVRAGRDAMRQTLLSWLPADLRGRRVLDAGCGTGALAVAAAERGAEVVAIDLSPTLVDLARERTPRDLAIRFEVGDMLDPALGQFDHVVGMDSLIHYRASGHGGGGQPVGGADDGICAVHLRPAHAGADGDACGRAAVPARRPGACDRAGAAADDRPIADPVARPAGLAPGADAPSRDHGVLHVARAGVGSGMSKLHRINARLAGNWSRLGPTLLPFADETVIGVPMSRLLRLSLFQVSVGMALVLLIGTLNRVMIVELGVPAWLVGAMVSLPLIFAPFRALVGWRSDTHKSVLGWKRVPYIWMGTLLQFGGLAIMPFALIILSGDTTGPIIVGQIAAALAFLLVGAGLHIVQTAGLALATDITPVEAHPRVVALLCIMMMLGMVGSALTFGVVLAHFSEVRLIQVIQGTAVFTMLANMLALWKQEAREPSRTAPNRPQRSFSEAWASFAMGRQTRRRLTALGLGTVAFSMQDILLEPYGGQVLHLTVGMTTALTAALATGGLCGFALAARLLGRGADPYRLASIGVLAGLVAFSAVIFAAPLASAALFAMGVAMIGFGAGLFAHCTLTAAMGMAGRDQVGMVLGVWGAVQATAAGGAVAISGLARDGISTLAERGVFGTALANPATGYGAVYVTELVLLFATLVALGPLVRPATSRTIPYFASSLEVKP